MLYLHNIETLHVRFVCSKPDYLYNICFWESMRKHLMSPHTNLIPLLINLFPIHSQPQAPLIKSFSYQLPWKCSLARRTACSVETSGFGFNQLFNYETIKLPIPPHQHTKLYIARRFNQFHIMFWIVNYSIA